jgi:hypothetical protein
LHARLLAMPAFTEFRKSLPARFTPTKFIPKPYVPPVDWGAQGHSTVESL